MSKTNLQILLWVGLVGSFLGTYYSIFIALLGVLFYPNVFYIIRWGLLTVVFLAMGAGCLIGLVTLKRSNPARK